MKSQSLVAYGEPLAETTREAPVPTGTQVLLKITHCGVCHSDLHLQDGYFELGGDKKLDVTGGRELPFTLGHEIEGEVVAAGPDADGVSIGDKVVAYPWIGCADCATCGRGEEHLCSEKGAHVLGVTVDGGFADHVMVPHPRYLLDYSGIPAGLAGTYMCSGLTAYSALKKIGTPGEGDQILIVGLGGVGMMGLQFARALFGTAPLVADIDEGKLEAARQMGAHAAYDSSQKESVKALLAETGGGVYAAIDFVGSESSFAFANRAVRKGGRIVVVGLLGGALTMPLPMIPIRAISIAGSFVGSLEETREVLDLVKAGKVAPIPVEERPMTGANSALDDLRGRQVTGRVVLAP